MNFIRKFKTCTKKRLIVILCSIIFCLFIFYTIHSSGYCLQLLVNRKVSSICKKYYNDEATGSLCHDLCLEKSIIIDYQCPVGSLTNEALFTGKRHDKILVFKKANPTNNQNEQFSWFDKDGMEIYPSQYQLNGMIYRSILFNYNMTLSAEKTALFLSIVQDYNQKIKHISMRDAWNLIQDNEIVISNLLESTELFPTFYGTCGDLYAFEYLDSLDRGVTGQTVSLSIWKNRIKTAVLILDFIEESDNNQPPLRMCNVEYDHFGISDSRLKYHNLNYVFPASYVDRKLSDAKVCSTDDDCNFKSCRTKCNEHLGKCTYMQLNNNLQIICEKIFRDILVTTRSSVNLLSLIERCSNPEQLTDKDNKYILGTSKNVRDALYSELTNIYEILATKS